MSLPDPIFTNQPSVVIVSRLLVWIMVLGIITLSILILSSCAQTEEAKNARIAARLLSQP